MRIGIIGAGNIGGTLTRRLTKLGHTVSVANSRGPESLKQLEQETGAKPVTVKEAARAGELVIVTIPMKHIKDLPPDLFKGTFENVVIVDTCNYYPQQRDGVIQVIEEGMPESRWVAQQLGREVAQQLGRRVVKAFNNIYAQHLMDLGQPKGRAGRIALPVAGDDRDAKALVMRIVDELGFDPVDAGTLDESWRQQPGTPVYTKDLDAAALRRALGEASPERKPEWRATAQSPGTYQRPA